jgi:hypothetical protein
MTDTTARDRRSLWAVGLAVVLPLALLLAFLSTPLSRMERGYYSPADLGQGAVMTRMRPGNGPKNPVLSDPAVQMHPWLMFNRDALAAGQVPLWNDWNGTGAPHLANYQSAVFSPFSLPFYVLGFRWALIVSAAAKLLCLGLASYAFFRALELRPLAAVAGAVAFAFSGLNVLLLAYPHSSVAITLPAGLWCVERAVRARVAWLAGDRAPGSGSRPGTGWVLGFGLVLAAGLYCGHPEPFAFALLVIGAYLAARLASAWARHRSRPGALRALLGLALQLALAGLLAAGLAAAQLAPFLEYLAHSSTLDSRHMFPLERGNWPLSVFPDALGNPSTGTMMAFDLPFSNYEEVNTAYVGGLVLWLAALGALVARSRQYLFFLGCALVGVVYGYDLLGLHRILGPHLLLSVTPMRRSQVLEVFGLCACAALCVDRLAVRGPLRARTVVVALAAAAGLGLVAWLGAERLFERSLARGPTVSDPLELERFAAHHFRAMGASLAVGALALVAALCTRVQLLRAAGGAVFVAALFFQTGFLLKDYNPTIDEETFFPVTPLLQQIRDEVGDRRLLVMGEQCVPPEANLPYGLRLAASYDALWVRPFDDLYCSMFGSTDNWRTATRVTENGLKLCAVEYVLTTEPWDSPGTETCSGDTTAPGWNWVELAQGRVSQTFVGEKEGLQSIELLVSRAPSEESRNLRAVLKDAATGAKLAAAWLDAPALDALPGDPPETAVASSVFFRFGPLDDSLGKKYRLTVRATRGKGENPVALALASREAIRSGENYKVDGVPVGSRLWFNRAYASDPFESVLHVAPYSLWRYRRSLGRFFCVDDAEVVPSDAEALERLQDPEFDPARTVLLAEAPPPEPPDPSTALLAPAAASPGPLAGADAAPTVLVDTHTHTRLRVERSHPGYLVISRAHYPGWTARVNGTRQELLRADLGLSALRLPAGESEVELRYAPRSFELGLWTSGLCGLVWVAWAALAARPSRRVPPPPAGG